jgi:cytochrome oxidase assembly protein ShyY1
MLWGAIASFILAALMAVLVGLGVWHARRTAPDTELIRPQAEPIPAA